MKKIILILLACLQLSTTFAQEQIKYGTINVVSNGLIGGFGCMFKNGFTIKNMKSGFEKGCVSGLLTYASKEMLRNHVSKWYKVDWKVFWTSKLLDEAGNTALRNAIMNDRIYRNFGVSIGFLRFNVNKESPVQLLPVSMICTGYMFLKSGNRFNRKMSLKTGVLIFNTPSDVEPNGPEVLYVKPKTLGYALANNCGIYAFLQDNRVLMHEVTHIYQRNSLMIFNCFVKHSLSRFILIDISLFDPLYAGQYFMSKYNSDNNYFEKEANYFGKSKGWKEITCWPATY